MNRIPLNQSSNTDGIYKKLIMGNDCRSNMKSVQDLEGDVTQLGKYDMRESKISLRSSNRKSNSSASMPEV